MNSFHVLLGIFVTEWFDGHLVGKYLFKINKTLEQRRYLSFFLLTNISCFNTIFFANVSWSFVKDRRVVNRVTLNGNEWQREVQRMTTSGTTSDNEWQRVAQQVTTSDNKWQRMTTSNKKWQWVTANDMTASDKTNEYKWE